MTGTEARDRRTASAGADAADTSRSPASMLARLLGDLEQAAYPAQRRRAADGDLAFVGSAIAQLVEEVADYAMLILDTGGHVSSWNRGAQRIKGYAAEEIIGQHFSTFYPEADVAAGRCADLLRTAELVGRAEHEGWRVRRDGSQFWANVVITALRDADHRLIGFGKVTRDLTERRRHEEHLEHLATHDALSDLVNRRAFSAALADHLRGPGRTGAGALLLVDLDHFKTVNDTLGHAEGDQLIQATAGILRRCLAGTRGLPARIGGDEFAVLLPASNAAEAVALAQTLISAVVGWAHERYGPAGPRVSASVGVCADLVGDVAPDHVMARADKALYAAKRAGRGRVSVAR